MSGFSRRQCDRVCGPLERVGRAEPTPTIQGLEPRRRGKMHPANGLFSKAKFDSIVTTNRAQPRGLSRRIASPPLTSQLCGKPCEKQNQRYHHEPGPPPCVPPDAIGRPQVQQREHQPNPSKAGSSREIERDRDGKERARHQEGRSLGSNADTCEDKPAKNCRPAHEDRKNIHSFSMFSLLPEYRIPGVERSR